MYIFHMVLLCVLFQPLFRNSIEIIHVYRVLHFYPVILKNLICILFYHIRSMGLCFLYLKVLCVCVFLIFCGWKAWIFAFNPFFQVWWWRRNCVTFSAHFHWLSAHVFSSYCVSTSSTMYICTSILKQRIFYLLFFGLQCNVAIANLKLYKKYSLL